MRFIIIVLAITAATIAISWLNYRLLARHIVSLQNKGIRYSYLLFSLTIMAVFGYGWSQRPPLIISEFENFRFFIYLGIDWLVGQLILLLFQPLLYLVQRLLGRKQQQGVQTPPEQEAEKTGVCLSRRTFLQSAVAVAPLLAFGISTQGIVEAQTAMAVQRHRLRMNDLPAALEGFKICQISDTHLGPYFRLDKLDQVLQQARQEQPDLVVITGDLIDDLSMLQPAMAQLDALAARIPHGIYYCMGNHDYYRNIDAVRLALARSRVRHLENCNALILPGEQPFYLLGTDYPWATNQYAGLTVSSDVRRRLFATADHDLPAKAFKVLIAHHPDCLLDGFAAKIPLTLTGHTHGGQVVVAGRSLLNSYQYMRGLYQENGVYGYVSSGTGHWMPLRFGCPPEIGIFILEK